MHLVLYHVTELKHVDHTYSSGLVETLAGTRRRRDRSCHNGGSPALSVHELMSSIEGAVENRGGRIFSPSSRHPSENGFEDLSEEFIREGTPRGFRTISTGVPSARKSMSSWRTMRLTIPLFPWRSAHLVADADLALLGDVDLGDLHDAGRQLVADGDVELLASELGVDFLALLEIVDDGAADEVVGMGVVCPVAEAKGIVVDSAENGVGEFGALGHDFAAEEVVTPADVRPEVTVRSLLTSTLREIVELSFIFFVELGQLCVC